MDGGNGLQSKEKPGLEQGLAVTFVDIVTEAQEMPKAPRKGYKW